MSILSLPAGLTYFAIYHTDDGRAKTHTGNEADMPMVLREKRAHARHDKQGSDVGESMPCERLFRSNESYQQATSIEQGHANMADVLYGILRRRRLCASACR